MKKTIFLFALCVFSIARISAQVQTIVSATAEISSCFNNTGDTTVSLKCGYDYTWKHPSDPSKNIYCEESGDYQRTLSNYRGCDSVVTLHLTIPETDCAPEGVASGKAIFSVASGKQVYFSKGNLQYSSEGKRTINEKDKDGKYYTKDGTFSFVTNQWEYGSLFGYGSSGKAVSNGQYEPLRRGIYSDFPNSTIEKTNYDWGVYNVINGGGDTVNIWRTLTNAEWGYLFGESSERVNKWGWCKVHNIWGLVILPDVWSCSVSFTAGIDANTTYQDAQWTLMEEAGAVFLPAGGCYNNGWRYYQNSYIECFYWSSTYKSDNTSYCLWAGLHNGTKYMSPQHAFGVAQGQSVRLVQDKKD